MTTVKDFLSDNVYFYLYPMKQVGSVRACAFSKWDITRPEFDNSWDSEENTIYSWLGATPSLGVIEDSKSNYYRECGLFSLEYMLLLLYLIKIGNKIIGTTKLLEPRKCEIEKLLGFEIKNRKAMLEVPKVFMKRVKENEKLDWLIKRCYVRELTKREHEVLEKKGYKEAVFQGKEYSGVKYSEILECFSSISKTVRYQKAILPWNKPTSKDEELAASFEDSVSKFKSHFLNSDRIVSVNLKELLVTK